MYLAFIGCAGRAFIKQRIEDVTSQLVARAGSIENIRRWYLWTPMQLSIMSKVEDLPKLLIIGGNGTGKTTLLESAAMHIADKDDENNVVYIIVTKYPNLLFRLQMEVKFENWRNVKVIVKASFSEIIDLLTNPLDMPSNAYVFIDELAAPDPHDCSVFKEVSNMRVKSVWCVIRASKRHAGNDPEQALRDEFKDWTIVHLKYPLRTTKTISNYVKKIPKWHELHGLGNDFNSSLNIDVNLPIGPDWRIIERKEGSYARRLKIAYNDIHNPALIILNVLDMEPTFREIENSKNFPYFGKLVQAKSLILSRGTKTLSTKKERLLVGIEAVMEACEVHGRPQPLLWFDKHYNEDIFVSESQAERAIKNNMFEEDNNYKEDIVTDNDCVAGYEANIVILLGESLLAESTRFQRTQNTWSEHAAELTMGRCSGQFILIP